MTTSRFNECKIGISLPGAFDYNLFSQIEVEHCLSLAEFIATEKSLCATVFVMEEALIMLINRYSELIFGEDVKVELIGVAQDKSATSLLLGLGVQVIEPALYLHLVSGQHSRADRTPANIEEEIQDETYSSKG